MANQQTGNYQLSQWERTDRILMEDFNHDNAKIDTALNALDTALKSKADTADITALQAQIANCGNCKLVTGSYTGTGTYGASSKNTLTFSGKPFLVFVAGKYQFFALRAVDYANCFSPSADYEVPLTLTWGENSLAWYSTNNAERQCNTSGETYYYAALIPC